MKTISLPKKQKRTDPLEQTIQADIRKAYARLPWITAYRNNTGKWRDEQGNWIEYGLCVGSSDLICIVRRPVQFSAWESGNVGVFLAVEVKRPGKEPTPDQLLFIEHVKRMGGFGGVAYNVLDAMALANLAHGGT